ncbi:hypothetical protein FRX31_028143, partial [Thalictrum thalictroides]
MAEFTDTQDSWLNQAAILERSLSVSMEFLIEAAKKVGIEGVEEFLNDPKNGLQEVYADLEKYSGSISGVPYYV